MLLRRLAPEYGGDRGKAVGLCAGRTGPAAFFPAHWAPNDLLIVTNPKVRPVHIQAVALPFMAK
jgi:hypothetical protein